jgi:glyoxylase-like metal-dependent hydrolase (beta-lactamase superfamily II)
MSMDGFEDQGAPALAPRLSYPLGRETPAPGAAREIAPGVHWVCMPMPMALAWINLWMIEDGGGWTIVDTGLALDETRGYWRSIFDSTLKGKPVTRVICTHMHPDHMGNAGWISRKFGGARLWTSRLEYISARMLVADTGREAPEDGVRFYVQAGWTPEQVEGYKARFGGFGRMFTRLPDSYRRLTDGESIDIGGRAWRVITGNGHSPDHICLWQPELKLFISGDQVLPRITSNVSVFPTEPEADQLSDWLASCKKLREAIPGDVLVLPAHNEPFTGVHARLDQLIEGHERSLDRLEKRLREGERRAVDVFGALFARKIGDDVISMATGEAVAHLNCLVARGRARRRLRDGVLYYEAA